MSDLLYPLFYQVRSITQQKTEFSGWHPESMSFGMVLYRTMQQICAMTSESRKI